MGDHLSGLHNEAGKDVVAVECGPQLCGREGHEHVVDASLVVLDHVLERFVEIFPVFLFFEGFLLGEVVDEHSL